MKWIRDSEGDLVNASNLDSISIENMGEDYSIQFRVLGNTKEYTYYLWEGKSLEDAKAKLEEIEHWLRR